MNSNDNELLRLYASERSESAIAELVRRHIDVVFSAALRQVNGDRQLAEDVTQSVFTDLAKKAHRLTVHSSIVGWLYTSTRFTAATVRRSEERRRHREQETLGMTDFNTTADAEMAWMDLRPVIDAAMQELKAEDREAVLLRFFERLPLGTVGARLGVTENAARMRVERAIERLRNELLRRGITSTSAALAITLTARASSETPSGVADRVITAALAGAGVASLFSLLLSKVVAASGLTKTAAVAVLAVAIGIPVWHQAHAPSSSLAETSAKAFALGAPMSNTAVISNEVSADSPLVAERSATAATSNGIDFRLVHKLTKQPIIDAPLRIKFGNWYNEDGVLHVHTDAAGKFFIPLPETIPPLVHVKVRKPGFGAMYVSWFSATNLGGLPGEYTLELEPGTGIGGVVLNEAGLSLAQRWIWNRTSGCRALADRSMKRVAAGSLGEIT